MFRLQWIFTGFNNWFVVISNGDLLIPGNHKLTATAKVIVKICEHEVSMGRRSILFSGLQKTPTIVTPTMILLFQMNEIEVCPECYLSACQKRDNWFCEPCVSSVT